MMSNLLIVSKNYKNELVKFLKTPEPNSNSPQHLLSIYVWASLSVQ